MKSTEEKFRTVVEKNTFYFFNQEFEQNYEVQTINAVCNLLQLLQIKVQQDGPRKDFFEETLLKPEGLKAILALNGFSNESLKRLITFVRITKDEALQSLILKGNWCPAETIESIKEWSDQAIEKLLRENEYFRRGLVNVFFEGASNPMLRKIVPPFDLKKLGVEKLSFRPEAMIDTLVRYKEKGSYSGKKKNNPEEVIRKMLNELGLPNTNGDLKRLKGVVDDKKRTMDFIIPNHEQPRIIAESSFLVTTSSGQGDKSKTEISIRDLIRKYYPQATFIGFVDGIGWYARQNDLKRMVSAYDDVFTFHPEELERFKNLVIEIFAL